MVRTRISRIILIAICLFLSSAAQKEKSLTFGVVPQQSSKKLAQVWLPIIKQISKSTGIKIRFSTAPSIVEFEDRLMKGVYDIAYMNPYHYVTFSNATGYEAIAKAKDKKIKGILVVEKTSQISHIKELSGLDIAFPAPGAFAASILIRSHLKKEKIEFTPHYLQSHDSVYQAVSKKLYKAGGGVVRTLNATERNVRDQLRVLFTTDGYTPHAIASLPTVSKETRDKIVEAMVALSETKKGSRSLVQLKIAGFEPAIDSDWNDVRSLDIDHKLGNP